MKDSPWLAAAAGALVCLCAVVLISKRAQIVSAARRSPSAASAALTLAAAAVWLAHLAGRRQPPPSHPVPDRDLTPTPRAPPAPPRPAEVDHAHDVPVDVSPDSAAPLVVAPDPDLGDLVLRLDKRARSRADAAD